MIGRAAGVLVLAALAGGPSLGCAARQTTEPGGVLIDQDDPAAGPPPEAAETTRPAPPAPAPQRQRHGRVDRAQLDRVLAAGPGAFLARVEVRAHLKGHRFAGWEVVRSPYPGIDVVPGDVVLSVNGHTLEHPVDFGDLWRELSSADAIRVDIDRSGRRFALTFEVEPGPDGTAPARDKVAP